MNTLHKIFFKLTDIRRIYDVYSIGKTLIFQHILRKKTKWNIGYIRANWKNDFDINKIKKIPNQKNRWFADPFVVKHSKFHYIFFEDYSLKNKKGSISCIKIDKKNKTKYYKEIIKENFHLSFPFIFKFNKNFFMTPESSENNSIRLYKCIKFPNKWKFFKKIVTGINCVDPVIFKWKNKWVLIVSKGKNEFLYNKLYVYTSKNPLSSSWDPLDINPVITSNIFGRNAGFIKESNKKIYRISQAYLPGNYGAFVSINKILNISKNRYYEKKIKKILPSYQKNIRGIHTLNYVKNFTVFDDSKWTK